MLEYAGNKIKRICRAAVIFAACVGALCLPATAGADVADDLRLEGDYILSCQYVADPSNAAYGAINNVTGDPTWVKPGENAMAIMGLVRTSEYLGDAGYRDRAQLAADYLMNVQDANDGGWYDQYSYANAVSGAGKPLRHTAEVMIAYDKLGYDAGRYDSMKKAAQFILAAQDVNNKGGIDDGLVGGGLDSSGQYHQWRWTSDNAFAYQSLRAAANWAQYSGDTAFAGELNSAAARILAGIQTYLSAGNDHWKRVIDENGNVVEAENISDWISYAPLMLDLPMDQAKAQDVGEWIHSTLQKEDGSLVWDDADYSDRKSPGYSFQAILAWLDSGQISYAEAAELWARASGLWQTTPDSGGISGGWIDWIEGTETAPDWQRFIDTSAYFAMISTGGYDFNPAVVPEPSSVLTFLFGLFGIFGLKKRN